VQLKKWKHQDLIPAESSAPTSPIVAIGASAGGLEAFSNLLQSLPSEPGLALVFIPRLDPTHESAMVALLSSTTRLPLLQAAEGIRVVVNSVYVLPPNSDITISGRVLHLVRREAGRVIRCRSTHFSGLSRKINQRRDWGDPVGHCERRYSGPRRCPRCRQPMKYRETVF
jgi:chemotaxis response regulator CheB